MWKNVFFNLINSEIGYEIPTIMLRISKLTYKKDKEEQTKLAENENEELKYDINSILDKKSISVGTFAIFLLHSPILPKVITTSITLSLY